MPALPPALRDTLSEADRVAWWAQHQQLPWPPVEDCVEQAAQAYRANHFDQALVWALAALARSTEHAVAWNTVGAVYRRWGRLAVAEPLFHRAIAARADYASPWSNLSFLYAELGRHADAEQAARRAIELEPHNANAWNNLGNALQRVGRLPESLEAFGQVLALEPGHRTALSNYLLAVQYASGMIPDEVADKHRAFGQRFASTLAAFTHWPGSPPVEQRRLRVGYVSPDLRDHSVAYFLEPLVAGHDRAQVELYAYDCKGKRDAVNARLRGLFQHWRDVALLSDDALCEQIRADGIDILIDVAGHTAGNRMAVFARKPAPVQVTWLGHPNTTGLPTIDWRLTDWVCDPPGVEHRYSERLWRLPGSFCVYRPCVRNPVLRHDARYQPQAAPYERNGFITFGSLNNPGKINDDVIALWCRILQAVPGSRLLLESPDFATPEGVQRVQDRFAPHGIGPERLQLPERDVRKQYLRYHEMDIALDPFPTNGGTTTCDILWFGLPIVVMEGESFVARMGTGFLRTVGLGQWVARTPDEYLALAVALARQPEALTPLRQRVRALTEASPLMDEAAFARHVDQALRGMWLLWCAQQKKDEPGSAPLLAPPDLPDRIQAAQALNCGSLEPMDRLVQALLARQPDDTWALTQQGALLAARHQRSEALQIFERVAQLKPDDGMNSVRLAQLYIDSRRRPEALQAARRATELLPDNADAWLMLAGAAQLLEQFALAAQAAERCVALRPDHPGGYVNRAVALASQGCIAQALAVYREMMQRWPGELLAYGNFLLDALSEPGVSLAELVQVARRYGQVLEQQARLRPLPEAPPAQAAPWRRLRLAVLSPDLNLHSVMYFLEPVLARLDRDAFEIWAYYTYSGGDDVTARVERMCDRFVRVAGMPPRELAQRLQADGMDVALDVAGHTGRSALAALAWHPAPVQVTWLGYPGTTGLPGVGWRLTDGVADRDPGPLHADGVPDERLAGVPPLAEQYTEKLVLLPAPFCVYRPGIRHPLLRYEPQYRVRPAPALESGVVTFGCCNNLAKLTPGTLAAWARILAAVPGARLLLEGKGLDNEAGRAQWQARCAQAGIDTERLELVPRDTRNQYLTYHRIDVALDPFPLTGGTTSFDVLWMGVPLVTLAGASFRSRMGVSLLAAAGLQQWVACTEDEYVDIAIRLASDLPALNARRLAQRARIEASPLMDEQRFTRLFEEALRRAWLDWCARQQAPGADAAARQRQVGQWLAQRPAQPPARQWVFVAPGERLELPAAHAQLQALWDAARQAPSAQPGQPVDARWRALVDMAQRVLESVPGDAAALVAVAEAEHAHGQMQRALALMAHAWDAAPQAVALGRRLCGWLQALGRHEEARRVHAAAAARGVQL